MWPAGGADDNRRFLADLRALRSTAAVDWDEMAARTHYPSDVLKEAETGPSLPGLPVLTAFVRACDGDVPEWEERWRRLGFDAHADPSLPVRPAGNSPAAVAGARAGVSVAPPDAYDPERIRAALRGSHGSPDRGGRASGGRAAAAPVPAPSWEAPAEPATSWNGFARAEVGGKLANGNHHLSQPVETPEEARAEAIRRDPFSADWLQDSEFTPPSDEAPLDQTEPPDSWFTPQETADREPSPEAEDSWFTPRDRADIEVLAEEPGPAEPELVTGFWTPSAPAGVAPGAADRTTPILAQAVAAVAAAPRVIAESAVPPGPVVPPSGSRSDRLYPVRLLIIIVVAALIGSILVLLLR